MTKRCNCACWFAACESLSLFRSDVELIDRSTNFNYILCIQYHLRLVCLSITSLEHSCCSDDLLIFIQYFYWKRSNDSSYKLYSRSRLTCHDDDRLMMKMKKSGRFPFPFALSSGIKKGIETRNDKSKAKV